jgi:rubrerythrin
VSTDRDIRIMQEALTLEIQAVQRYVDHAAMTHDPRFVAYWESLRRNESDHRDELAHRLAALGAVPGAPAERPADREDGGAQPAAAAVPPASTTARGDCPDVAGFRSTLAALAVDLEAEHAAVKTYGRFAAEADDPPVKALFRELVRAESGHARGLRAHTERIAQGNFLVALYCPLCGWQVDLGADPAMDTEVKCPMCAARFVLQLRGGDWALERIKS